MNRTRWISLAAVALLVIGCGEDEADPDPRTHCQEQNLKAYTVGSATGERGSASFEISDSNGTPGRITDTQVRITLGEASPPGTDDDQPLILYLTDTVIDHDLYQEFSRRTDDGRLVLDIADASQPPEGEEDVTSVSHIDCSVQQDDTICAQVGYDSAGDGILGDDDEFVYNAVDGQLVIEDVDNIASTISMNWDIEAGPNVHVFEDDSTGEFRGCAIPEYDIDAPYGWELL